MRNKKEGISLIVLVITILVMIILAGTIILTLTNNNIISKTQHAINENDKSAEKEALMLLVVDSLTSDGKVDFSDLDSKLPARFTGSNGRYHGELGINYEVDDEGKITVVSPPIETADMPLLKNYFLGTDNNGINLFDIIDDDTFTFIDNDIIPNASTSLEFLGANQNIGIYVKYNNKMYRVSYTMDPNTEMPTTNDIQFIYEPHGREGQTILYSYNEDPAEEWTIINDKGTTVEIMAPEPMGSITLSPDAEDAIGSTLEEKAKYMYNNAITKINNYCKELINDDDLNVRSVGSNPANPYSESGFVNLPGAANYSENFKGPDMNYEHDYLRIAYFGLDSSTNYIFASRQMIDFQNNGGYILSFMTMNDSAITISNLIDIAGNTMYLETNYTYAVRPVIEIAL